MIDGFTFVIYRYAKAFCVLFFVGIYATGTQALPQSIETNGLSLNIMISSVMRHYQQVIAHNGGDGYPENVKNIQILNAKLDTKNDFIIELKLSYLERNKLKIQRINEIFKFDLNKNLVLIGVNRQKTQTIYSSTSLVEFNIEYYQKRSFAYAWMAFLDNNLNLPLPRKNIENAFYQLEMGVNRYAGSLFDALNKRNLWMGKGEHLLRNISSSTINNHLQLILIIDWKGVNSKGKPSIAKIKQIIELEKVGKVYRILNIKEQYLLPSAAPWEKLLC